MKPLLLSIFILFSFRVYAEDALWLERNWISDKEATLVANPAIAQLPEDTLEKFIGMFGKVKWEIDDGILTSINDEFKTSYESIYTIIPNTDDNYDFQIALIDEDGSYSTFYVWRVETGFCTTIASSITGDSERDWSQIVWEHRSISETTVECFKPNDNQ